MQELAKRNIASKKSTNIQKKSLVVTRLNLLAKPTGVKQNFISKILRVRCSR